jgi:hypothetical protein
MLVNEILKHGTQTNTYNSTHTIYHQQVQVVV